MRSPPIEETVAAHLCSAKRIGDLQRIFCGQATVFASDPVTAVSLSRSKTEAFPLDCGRYHDCLYEPRFRMPLAH